MDAFIEKLDKVRKTKFVICMAFLYLSWKGGINPLYPTLVAIAYFVTDGFVKIFEKKKA